MTLFDFLFIGGALVMAILLLARATLKSLTLRVSCACGDPRR